MGLFSIQLLTRSLFLEEGIPLVYFIANPPGAPRISLLRAITDPDELAGAKPENNSSALFTTETRVVRKNRSAGVSPASEPRQLLLGQHDLCRLEAGDTFFLTTTEYTERHGEP